MNLYQFDWQLYKNYQFKEAVLYYNGYREDYIKEHARLKLHQDFQ